MSPRIQDADDLKKELIKQLKKLKNKLDADLVTLHLYDADRDRVYFPIGIGLEDKERFYRSVPSRKRVVGKLIRDQKPITAADALHHPDFTGPFTHMEKVKSGIGFPLIHKDTNDVVGVAFVNFRQFHQFSDDEKTFFEKWAYKISDLIHTTLQTEESRRLRADIRRETDQRRKEFRLQELMEQIRETIRDVDVALWLEKRKEKALSISVSTGIDTFFTQDTKIAINNKRNLISRVFTSENDEIENDLREKPDIIFGTNESLPWEKALAIPISSENHKLGVLSVLRRDSFVFSPRELDILHMFARLLAVTIRNEDRIIIQSALHDLGMRLTVSLELKEILQEVVRIACQVIDADIATVHLYDHHKQEFLDLDQAAVYPKESRKDMEKPRASGGLSNNIIKKQRFYIEDVKKKKDASTFIRKQRIKAYVGIPLISNDQSLGVMYVNFKQTRHFAPDELSLIQLLADNAAAAIYRNRLFEQRATVTEIAKKIASSLDVDDVMQTILRESLQLLHCKEGSIALFDKQSKELVFQYAEGKQKWTRISIDEGLMGKAARPKKPIRVGDVTKNKDYITHVGETRSELDVPLLAGDELIGVLNAENPLINAFSEEDEKLAMVLASQAAVAIVNAKLFKKSNNRAEALKSLHEVAPALVSISEAPENLDKILTQIVRNAQNVLGADLVDLYRYIQDNDNFILPPVLFGDRKTSVVKEKIYKDDVLYDIVQGKVAKYVENFQKAPDFTGEFSVKRSNIPEERFVIREKIISSASIPLIVENEVVGVLFANYRAPQVFSQQQKELIELFANQAAIAIYNARQYKDIQKRLTERLDDIEAFREITETMHQGELTEVLDMIAEKAVAMTDAKYGGVWLLNKTQTLLKFGGLSKHAETEKIPPDIPVSQESESSINKRVIRDKKSYLCQDVTCDKNYKEWYVDTRSELAVPMIFQDRVIGSINVESTIENGLTLDHQRLLEALAGQAAVVVQNARLIERLEILDDIGNVLTSGTRLNEDEILKLIFKQVKKLTGAQDMYIALYNEDTNEIRFPLATEKGERVEYPSRKADMEKRGKTEEIIFTQESILHKTKDEAEQWYGQPGHAEFVDLILPSWLGVPMIARNKVNGVIAVYDLEIEHAFNELHLSILSSMASQAAIAIENSKLYEAARDDAKAKGKLAALGTVMATLQHRINNSFNIIVPNVTRLRSRVDVDDDTISEILGIIERNARYTSDIISRIQKQLQHETVQGVNVNTIVQDVTVRIKQNRKTDSISFVFKMDDTIPIITAPSGQIAEVFYNLIDNACREMQEGGKIVLSTELKDDKIYVRVKDTGPGIPPKIQQRLFKQPVSSYEKGGGAGLGLWLSQLMLQSINGDIWIEETSQDGTLMCVEIPPDSSTIEGGKK